jgi:hypothetical protein
VCRIPHHVLHVLGQDQHGDAVVRHRHWQAAINRMPYLRTATNLPHKLNAFFCHVQGLKRTQHTDETMAGMALNPGRAPRLGPIDKGVAGEVRHGGILTAGMR